MVDVTAPDGQRLEHHRVLLEPAAIALVVDETAGEVLTLYRERWAVGEWGYELLGGLVAAGEDPAEAARRECIEESGWCPRGDPERLLTFQPLPGVVVAPTSVYLWRRGADWHAPPSDPHEPGRISWLRLDEMAALTAAGRLLGAGTYVAVLQYLALSRRETPFVEVPNSGNS